MYKPKTQRFDSVLRRKSKLYKKDPLELTTVFTTEGRRQKTRRLDTYVDEWPEVNTQVVCEVQVIEFRLKS